MDVDVKVFPCCPPPVSQIQKLQREERIVGRQVSCSDKITQKKSALASFEALQCCGSWLRQETAPKGIPLQRSRDGDRREALSCGVAGPQRRAKEPSPAENKLSHTVANQAVRNLMAAQTQTHSVVWYCCVSLGVAALRRRRAFWIPCFHLR